MNHEARAGIDQDMRRISVPLTALTLVASAVLLVSGGAAEAQGLASYRHVPAQVFGTVAVGMPDPRTVQVQHYDPATQTWDAPSVLLKTRKHITCGAIDGRAAAPTGPGVALLIECDKPYYEDQAPVHSVALVSRDGVTWSRRELPGEAYQDPAISPSATYAAWLVGGHGEYVAWSAAAGFAAPAETTYDGDGGGETPVVDDAGTVTVVGPESAGRNCVLGFHSRDLAGNRTHTVLDTVDPGCTEGSVENQDDRTLLGNPGYGRENQYLVQRASTAAPWALTRARPLDAPGLVQYRGQRRRILTSFLETSDPSAPLLAYGSPDRRRILVQRYDEASQSWSPQREVYASARRCRDDYFFTEAATRLYAVQLRCGRGTVVLVSGDGATWTARKVGRRPWTLVGDAAALPGRQGTTLVTPSAVREFPETVDGRCDLVVPGREGELVRLHGGRWPTKVQVSTGGAFQTVSRSRKVAERCRSVFFESSLEPALIVLQSERRDRYARLVLRGATWRLVYPRRFG